jgi:hypothetical protein
MADLAITVANVIAGALASIDRHHNAGAAITSGQVVYLDTDGTYKLADDNGSAAARVPSGIALNAAAIGQPVAVVLSGPVTVGAALTPGVGYYLSSNPGGIAPAADLAAGQYPSFLGFAISATVLNLAIEQAGVSL